MLLTPRELDCLIVHEVGCLAQKRYARGIKLNYTEACGLIAAQLLELIRDGHSVSELMQSGKEILGSDDVLPGVADMLKEVQVEGTFPDGTKLVTVHDPICREYGNAELALYGSFIELPEVQKRKRRNAELRYGITDAYTIKVGTLPGNLLHAACESECAKAVPGAASVMSYPGETLIDTQVEDIDVSSEDRDSSSDDLTNTENACPSPISLVSQTSPQRHCLQQPKNKASRVEPFPNFTPSSNTVTELMETHLDAPYQIKHRLMTVAGQPLVAMLQQKHSGAASISSSKTSRQSNRTRYHPGNMIELNAGRRRILLTVTSTCDRPIQVGSHFHFIEVNPALQFDRLQALGMRLNIPAGHSVRFEPGETLEVPLVEIGGRRRIHGGNCIVDGSFDESKCEHRQNEILAKLYANKFSHQVEAIVRPAPPTRISRELYANTFGTSCVCGISPTVGDRIRLGDSCLLIEVEYDYNVYGDECRFGGGKVLREGMGQMSQCPCDEALDTVVTNAIIVDAITGIVKADIGIKNGRIVAIGKAGNPDVMDGVHPKLVVGAATECIAAEGLILTAGAIDTHVHFICPQIIPEALASGITTLIGGGTGPAAGSKATTCTPGRNHIQLMAESTDMMPINIGFTGKGNSSSQGGKLPCDLEDQIIGGAIGLKLHEDWGTTPGAIDSCLTVADLYDVQVTIHTDTLNESSCVEGTLEAFKGRTIHTYHTEGAGGGHAPDILRAVGQPNVIPSSTNPTRPFTINTVEEHVDMLIVCHHLDSNLKEDLSFAESRIRAETIQAEDILHDLGAISLISSDAQAMGRIGEVICRTWQTAAKMKEQRGSLPPDLGSGNDNFRIKRYIAKYTINPAIAHGISHLVGSISEGLLADVVLWSPMFFGIKPKMVLKGGQIAWAEMGLANASIPTPEPVIYRPMFGACGSGPSRNSVLFVSKACLDQDVPTKNRWRVSKTIVPVYNCRNIGKKDMVLNDLRPEIRVDPQNYQVQISCEITPPTSLTTAASSLESYPNTSSMSTQSNNLEIEHLSKSKSNHGVSQNLSNTHSQNYNTQESIDPTDKVNKTKYNISSHSPKDCLRSQNKSCREEEGGIPNFNAKRTMLSHDENTIRLLKDEENCSNTVSPHCGIGEKKSIQQRQQIHENTIGGLFLSNSKVGHHHHHREETQPEDLSTSPLSSSRNSTTSSVWVTLECEPAEILPLAQRYLLF